MRNLSGEKTFSAQELTEAIKGLVLFDASMQKHTTFQIGGPARILVIPKDIGDIQKSVIFAKRCGLPIHVIGNGSKILVSDEGISGLVIKISSVFDELSIFSNTLKVGAGYNLAKLLSIAIDHNLSGLEFAAGIPGTLGGAIAMNAGTFVGSMSNLINNVSVLDLGSLDLMTLSKEECRFHYRSSVFQEGSLLILSAELNLSSGIAIDMQKKISQLLEKRRESQPLDKPNAGSIFKNPEGYSAAKLIDSVGLKGVRVGDAQVSDKHANFIVNLGNASAKDVLTLVKLIQTEIKVKYGISLIPELQIIGQ